MKFKPQSLAQSPHINCLQPPSLLSTSHRRVFAQIGLFFSSPFHPPPAPSTACLAFTLRLSSENHLFEAFSSHPDPNTSAVWRTMVCVFSVISYMSLKLLESFTPVTPGLSTGAGSLTVASQMPLHRWRKEWGTPPGCTGGATFL